MRLKVQKYNPWMIPLAILIFGISFTLGYRLMPRVFANDADYIATPTDYFVTLYDGDKKLIVKTTAPTVRDLLDRLKVTYSSADIIEPALDIEITSDNFYINIFRARPVIIKDGLTAKYIMTAARDTRSIFEDAGYTLYDDDKISAVPSTSLLEVGLTETFSLTRGQAYADYLAEQKAAAEAAARAEAEAIARAEAEARAALEAKRRAAATRPEWATCAGYAREAGVSEADLGTALTLIYRESGCRVDAENAYSGAYGIPQALPKSKLAAAGEDWETNPITQIRWMINYVNNRYGGWSGALDHSDTYGWY